MTIFYILNNAPTIDAATPREAARQYALQKNILAGQITIATTVKVLDITDIPRDVKSVDAP